MNENEGEEKPSLEQPEAGASGEENDRNAPQSSELDDAHTAAPDSLAGKEGDALTWFEGPAFNSPVEEMPTLRWPEDRPRDGSDQIHEQVTSTNMVVDGQNLSEKVEPIDDLDDAIAWLEKLADGQGTPIDEMPTLVSGAVRDEATESTVIATPMVGGDILETTGATDSDPMAWLEQLAVDQDSPLEELPSVANRLLASDIASQTSNGANSRWQMADINEALSYLEVVAIREGVNFADVTFEDNEPVDSIEKELLIIDELAAASLPAAIGISEGMKTGTDEDWDNLSKQMPDDPDEALAWLGDMSDEAQEEDLQESIDAEGLVMSDSEELALDNLDHRQIQEQSEAVVDDQFLQEMPDDPDEAMAWMKDLADKPDDHETAIKIPEMSESEAGDAPQKIENEDLKQAAETFRSGDQKAAAEKYRSVINKGDIGSAVIEELENMVAQNPNDPQLYQLLGDAYMKEGHLQKALKAYQQQLAHS